MARKATGSIRVGIGGWTYAPWRGTFYPAKLPQARELAHASRQLSSIEINGTFYGSQKPRTFVKWHDETPDDFVFSLKAPRFATNRRVLADAGSSISRFVDSGISELKHKLGPINWQFAPTKRFEEGDFAAFLELLPKQVDGRPLRHAVEVRHDSFRTAAFIELLRRHRIAAVVAGDSPHPLIADLTADFIYARIMGTQENKPAGYSKPALDRWAVRARAWAGGATAPGLEPVIEPTDAPRGGRRAKPRDVYLYVISGHKAKNPAAAQALSERLK